MKNENEKLRIRDFYEYGKWASKWFLNGTPIKNGVLNIFS